MSDVIRRAIIELELRTKQSGAMNSPDMSAMKRAYDQEAQAAKIATSQASEATRAVQDQSKAVTQATSAHEEFGRRSSYAYSRGLGGIMEFGRGLALMVADGTEGNEKLLQSIVKIQAGTDLLRGGFLMARLGPELRGVAAVVSAGAAAWLLYSQQVERAKQQLKELATEHAKAIQAEEKFQAEQAHLAAKTRGDRTDATQVPSARRAAQAAELAAIRNERGEFTSGIGGIDASRQATERGAERARSQASALPRSFFDSIMTGEFFEDHGSTRAAEGILRRQSLEKRAGIMAKSAQDQGHEAITSTQQQLANAQREREILESQRDYEYGQLEAKHKGQLESLGDLPSAEGKLGTLHRQQRLRATEGEIGASAAIGSVGLGFGGAVAGLGAMQNLGPLIASQENIISGIQHGRGDVTFAFERNRLSGQGDAETKSAQDKWTNFLQGTISVVEQLQSRLNNLQSELDQANAANGH